MSEQLFDPFQDRLSRDIRNTLSTAFVESMEDKNMDAVLGVANSYMDQGTLSHCYRDYISHRLDEYQKALEVLWKGGDDPIWRGLVLWDQNLYFELHEVVEHAWYHAEGELKLVMQALIRAAGVFIKREYGYKPQADKIAVKAIAVLQTTSLLEPYCNTEVLLQCLNNPEEEKRKLLG